jgi:hypothetical protein
MAVAPSSRFGGTTGNEILTSVTALALTLLLAAEGITLLFLGQLLPEHMFIGLLLIPPTALKLGSTGYRFVRYYARSAAYRAKGPPSLPLRLLAPVLVVATVLVLGSGVTLLIIGHRSDTILELHKVSFIVWGVLFAVHFLAYLPRAARSLASDWSAERRRVVPGAAGRAGLLALAIAAGVAVALALLSQIDAWHRGGF